MATKSLKARKSQLSDTQRQLQILSEGIFSSGELPTFKEKLAPLGLSVLHPKKLSILQINIGYMCNQVCTHCHVDAGPDRKEIMTKTTLEDCLKMMKKTAIATVDITGGAPEMHPHFRWFVEQIRTRTRVKEIIVRSNLTILLANKKYWDLPLFFATHNIHVISSLPFYKEHKTDRQRGMGVFKQSIKALQLLNEVGFGRKGSHLELDLVYNPSGAFLPSDQSTLERDYKAALKQDFNIEFNQLFTITNLPISRFLDYLIASENYEEYMHTLVEAFNPMAVEKVMCTTTLSVDWEGFLYDCDFNQMLGLKANVNRPHINEYNPVELDNRTIQISQHCYGCTAGAGSSCQGSTV